MKLINDTRTVDDINKAYAGKNMSEIMKEEKLRQDIIRDDVDAKHNEICGDRTRMLTVQKLIDYLKTQNPNACILAYENNSFAYIEQWPDLPNHDILTVAEDKKLMEKDLKNWYKGIQDADKKIKADIEKTYRYAKDDDIIIKFN